jgi:hypothetical protein
MPTEISVRTTLPFEECLGLLRQKLQRERFRVVAQLQIDREFENRLGVHWRQSIVLVVWDSFHAYQASLCGVNGALFLPFNISFSDEAGFTLMATTNQSASGFGQGYWCVRGSACFGYLLLPVAPGRFVRPNARKQVMRCH